ncbi:MAG: DNA cytosine methyltransferase, partial [Candidatus Omnitrophica bacterium]|nr:DNA cytosine methyltransferase [Candidatus Omnitrophota bacterium]
MKHRNSSFQNTLFDSVFHYALATRCPQRGGPTFSLIDLFSGAGGMTLGFSEVFGHSFQAVWANDSNPHAVATYNYNFGDHCVLGDIEILVEDPSVQIPKADLVIGGPPCQGFSLLNKQRQCDDRRQLWRPFLQVVERSGARAFVMENVPQLLGSDECKQIELFAASIGFKTASAILRAADYGVPQTRYRAFIIGCNFLDPWEYFPPQRTHYNPNEGQARTVFTVEGSYINAPEPWRTVRDAIGDLPSPYGTDVRLEVPPMDLHFGRNPTPKSIKRYKAIPFEGMNRFDLHRNAPHLTPGCWKRKKNGGTDLFGRLWWDRPAFTIRTEFFKPEKGRYLHPSEHRPITHREAARLQSFPDSF